MSVKNKEKTILYIILLIILISLFSTFIFSVPTIEEVVISSSSGTNLTQDNLTATTTGQDANETLIFDWRSTKGEAELIVDGDMENAGVGDWTVQNNANLTKQTNNPHSGSQVLRVDYNDTSNPMAYQTILTSGKRYRVTGWARGDSTKNPAILDATTILWTGTSSTDWQYFDVTFISSGTSFKLRAVTTGSGYVEFDDVSVKEVTSDTVLNMPFDSNNSAGDSKQKDYSSYSNNGTVVNATFNRTGGYDGSGAFEFDGRVGGITTNSVVKNFELGGSLSIWAKQDEIKTNNYMIYHIGSGNQRLYLHTTNGGLDVMFVASNPASNTLTCSGCSEKDVWHNYVLTWDEHNGTASNYTAYEDGVQFDSKLYNKITDWSTITIGAPSYAFSNGSLDQFKMWNRSLSADEISAMYNGGAGLYNTTHSSATERGEFWETVVTPNDGYEDGNPVTSNGISINELPTLDGVKINSTLGTNLTTENITAFALNLTDPDSSSFYPIYDWRTDKGNNELLVDGDMENAGVGDWTVLGNANLTKQTINPKEGSQVMRIAYNDSTNPSAYQIILTVGKRYRVTGYARSDGVKDPAVINGGVILKSLNTSTSWQYFDVTFVAISTSLIIRATTTSTSYAEFDDVSVKEVTSDAVLNFPFNSNNSAGNNGTKDYSTYGNNGAVVNATFNRTGGYDGSGALEFNGNDYISIQDDDSIDPSDSTNGITYSAWVYPKINQTQEIIAKFKTGVISDDRFYLISNVLYMTINNGSATAFTVAGSTILPLNSWSHIVGVAKANENLSLYINGVLESTGEEFIGDFRQSVTPLFIGARNGFSSIDRFFNGSMDKVQLFNRSLSADEISAMYNGGAGLYNITHSDATLKTESWEVVVTPNDGYEDGNPVTSNALTIENTPPSAPNITNPVNNSYTSNSTIQWQNSSDNDTDSLTYILQVSNTTDFTIINYSNSTLTDLQHTFSTFQDGNWFTRVLANDGTDNSSWGSVINFTLDTTKPAINLIYPVHSASITEGYINFTFNITDANTISNCTLDFGGLNVTDTSIDKSNPVLSFYKNRDANIYRWKIYCTDNANNENVSETRTLILKNNEGAPSSSSGGGGLAGSPARTYLVSLNAIVPELWYLNKEITITNISTYNNKGKLSDANIGFYFYGFDNRFKILEITQEDDNTYTATIKPLVVLKEGFYNLSITADYNNRIKKDYSFELKEKEPFTLTVQQTFFTKNGTIAKAKDYVFDKSEKWTREQKIVVYGIAGIIMTLLLFILVWYLIDRKRKRE